MEGMRLFVGQPIINELKAHRPPDVGMHPFSEITRGELVDPCCQSFPSLANVAP